MRSKSLLSSGLVLASLAFMIACGQDKKKQNNHQDVAEESPQAEVVSNPEAETVTTPEVTPVTETTTQDTVEYQGNPTGIQNPLVSNGNLQPSSGTYYQPSPTATPYNPTGSQYSANTGVNGATSTDQYAYQNQQPSVNTSTSTVTRNTRNYVRIRFPKEIIAAKGENLLLPSEDVPLESLPVTTEAIYGIDGKVLIPRGSKIKGRITVLEGEPSIFNANSFIIGASEYPFAGTALIPSVPVETNYDAVGNFLGFTLGGAALATIISGLTGDRKITTEEVLIGAGVGLVSGTVRHYLKDKEAIAVGGASYQVESVLCLNGSAQQCFR